MSFRSAKRRSGEQKHGDRLATDKAGDAPPAFPMPSFGAERRAMAEHPYSLEVPQEPATSWIPLRLAPFLLRRREWTGKKGNRYFTNGTSFQRILKDLNEPPHMPMEYWDQFKAGRVPLPPHIAIAQMYRPTIGEISVEWRFARHQFTVGYDAQALDMSEQRIAKAVEEMAGGFFNEEERRLTEDYSERLFWAWRQMWGGFISAIEAGACSIVGRVEGPFSKKFTGLPSEILRRSAVVDWRLGDLRANDGTAIHSVWAVPIVASASPADVTFDEADTSPTAPTRAVVTKAMSRLDEPLPKIFERLRSRELSQRQLAKRLNARHSDNRDGLQGEPWPVSELALAKEIGRIRLAHEAGH